MAGGHDADGAAGPAGVSDLVVVEVTPWRRWSRVPVTLEHAIATRGVRVYDAAG
jgi:hypothetical protein